MSAFDIAVVPRSSQCAAVPSFLLAALALLLSSLGSAAASTRPTCPGIENGRASRVETDQIYDRRAVQMVRAALLNDDRELSVYVAPDARFELWRGDYSSSARSRGILGAIEFARDLNPVHFEVASVQPGPIVALVPDCKWSVTVLFRTSEAARGVSVRFDFEDGLVTVATGNEVALLSGNVR